MKRKHECEDVVGTLDLSIETHSDGEWMLCIWPSGDKQVGDWSLSYGISCCPFCEKKLRVKRERKSLKERIMEGVAKRDGTA